MTTHVFMDVDGVYNAFGGRYFDDPDAWGDLTETLVNRFTITYSPTLVARLNALAAREDTEFYWLTTWEEAAAEELSVALGIDGKDWPVAGRVPFREKGEWWKLRAIRTFVEDVTDPEDRIIWVDDDFYSDPDAQGWWKARLDDERQVLCICPKTHLGLTPDEVEKMERFTETGLSREEA